MKNVFGIFLLCLFAGLATSCKQTAGDKAETSQAGEVSEATGSDYTVDVATSKVLWEGTKPTGTHNGTVNLTEGSVSVNDGAITGGSFVLDMNSIVSLDLEGDMKANLEAHLKGTTEGKEDDFFNVTKYPTAKFEITKMTKLENNEDANYTVYGNLTMRDVTNEIGFRAQVDMSDGMVRVSTPQFKIDRTKWGIKFMSKNFFDDLKEHFVNDEIALKINLNARA